MAPKRKVTSRRRAKQFSLPFPLTPAQQTTYRAPAWQERIDVYAHNHFLPAELAHCRALGLRFLPFEAEMISRQLIGTPDLQKKVQRFIGSLYVYDAAYALLNELKEAMANVLAANENVNSTLVTNLLSNIRGYEFIKLAEVPGNGAGTFQGAINGKNYNTAGRADDAVQLHVLSTSEENQIRSKGYVTINGDYHTVARVPNPNAGPGDEQGPQMMPYAVTANNSYAVESCINMLIELANDKQIDTNYFSLQSRAAVFYPLGLEGPDNARAMYADPNTLQRLITQESMAGQGADLMRNIKNPPPFAPAVTDGLAVNSASRFDNSLRKISVPSSVTNWGRTMNAAVMEVQMLNARQKELIAALGDWAENGMGILAMDGVTFGDYLAPGGDTKKIMGNKPRQMKYLEANYSNDTCGTGYRRLWFTADPDTSDRARQVPGYLPSRSGGMVKNPEARYAKCAPFARQGGALPGGGAGVHTDMLYAVQPRTAAAQRRKRRTPAAAKKKTATRRKARK